MTWMSVTDPLVLVKVKASLKILPDTTTSYVDTPVDGLYPVEVSLIVPVLNEYEFAATTTPAGPVNDRWYVPGVITRPYPDWSSAENVKSCVGQPLASVFALAPDRA